MKKFAGIIIVLLLAAGFYLIYYYYGDNETGKELIFKTAKVLKGDLEVKVSATGVVEPNFKVEVKSKASGEVLNFSFDEGDYVEKGQLLLQLDKSDELRSVAKVQADLQGSLANLEKAKTLLLLQKNTYKTDLRTSVSEEVEAEANLEESQEKLKRQTDLFHKKFTSRETLESAERDYKVNQENLVQARSKLEAAKNSIHDIALREAEIELAKAEHTRTKIALDEARERLRETDIFAPISGTIIDKMVEQGQIISSGISNVSGGTALLTIADLKRLYIVADVDETDIGAVFKGQRVIITADALLGQAFKGKVLRVAPQGKTEDSVTIFKVKLEIMEEGIGRLKPMMTANVDIINEKLEDVLYVPREAIRKKNEKTYAAVLQDGMPNEIPVTTGIHNPIHIQVLTGLDMDQEILVGDWEKTLEQYEKSKDKSSTLRRILWLIRSK